MLLAFQINVNFKPEGFDQVIIQFTVQGFIQDFFHGGGTFVCGKVDQLQP